ncbi:hypothetical protein HA402_007050 [Bradysia odoriphaga]|nr:hypothetical protein HA402_007050 [Bradysia odoriphaga]
MALRLMAMSMKQGAKTPVCVRTLYTDRIGTREVVGYGWNGYPVYHDNLHYPMPPVRFREDTPEIKALREKEKGDWNKMSVHEKKALYRASFCQTFAEFQAPTGDWKLCIAGIFVASGLALLVTIWMNTCIYDERPESFSEAAQKAQLKRMLDLEVNPVQGLASKWDYENKRWK